MSDRVDDIVPANIASLVPYEPGKPIEEIERELGLSGVIKLASNENPVGPSRLAVAAAQAALAEAHLYPDTDVYRLRRKLAASLGVDPSELVFGAGSNELIHVIVRAFCRPRVDRVVSHRYAFPSYALAAHTHDAPFTEAAVTADLRCDVDALIAAMTDDTRIVFLANPNNPTGANLTTAEFERVRAAIPPRAILVVDEAYHEYASRMLADYPSSQRAWQAAPGGPMLLTLRTFSKIYGMAGFQIGYAIGDRRLVAIVNRVRRPFNVSSVAQAAAIAALDDTDHVERSVDAARESIAELSAAATRLGLRPYPSATNFVLIDVGRESTAVYQALLHQGVIVRPMASWGLERCIRISVGTPAQTARAVAALATVLS